MCCVCVSLILESDDELSTPLNYSIDSGPIFYPLFGVDMLASLDHLASDSRHTVVVT